MSRDFYDRYLFRSQLENILVLVILRLLLPVTLILLMMVEMGLTGEDVLFLLLELRRNKVLLRSFPLIWRLVIIVNLLPALAMLNARVGFVPLKGYWRRFQLRAHLL